ncbi:uncharacterized protein M421DRAFT_424293 [Didymella exigua CBS 183.55]|uniref:Uncharacterized protein n=1 Tax=Didymella exigua CBS 183.55 TaxID=1150837 RepID=A0A6A5R9I1_9PLEO|nr:uncharacterized protein M421DRAFT_424293 [Didymella exigua CBS 183.55]KAF1924871.1 hypothetical protein M421DRAFT_424293 [Didymella exigua CBS 183.55]
MADTVVYKTHKPVTGNLFLKKGIEVYLASPSLESPNLTEPDSSALSPKPVGLDKRYRAIQSTPSMLALGSEPEHRALSRAADSHNVMEHELTGDIKVALGSKEKAHGIPAKETAMRLMVRRKEQANNGPDHFLGLLNLVRKK